MTTIGRVIQTGSTDKNLQHVMSMWPLLDQVKKVYLRLQNSSSLESKQSLMPLQRTSLKTHCKTSRRQGVEPWGHICPNMDTGIKLTVSICVKHHSLPAQNFSSLLISPEVGQSLMELHTWSPGKQEVSLRHGEGIMPRGHTGGGTIPTASGGVMVHKAVLEC